MDIYLLRVRGHSSCWLKIDGRRGRGRQRGSTAEQWHQLMCLRSACKKEHKLMLRRAWTTV